MEKIDVLGYLNKVKNMQYFTVRKQLTEPLPFNGSVPFDIKINKAGVAMFKVLASSKEEADQQVTDWIYGLFNDPSEDFQ